MPRPLSVVLACSGLDHAHRGFETFARDCFAELRTWPELQMTLLKGSGPSGEHERAVRTLRRDTRLVEALSRATGKRAFRFEHVAFAFSLQRELLRLAPDVVYFSEWHTGLVLAALRRATRRDYSLVLSNGTMAEQGFDHLDRVQELTPIARTIVLERGADPSRHVVLPLGAPVPRELDALSAEDRAALRRRLGLPADRPVLLSLAALNTHHKRMDYLIDEIAALPGPRPFLLMAGQREDETPAIEARAAAALAPGDYDFRTVPHEQVADLCRAADACVLTSLGEALGRVLIEAAAAGLPCLVHDYAITRFVLGEHGVYGDFSVPGGLANLIAGGLPAREPGAAARHAHAYEHFSWERLRPRYVDLLRDAAACRQP